MAGPAGEEVHIAPGSAWGQNRRLSVVRALRRWVSPAPGKRFILLHPDPSTSQTGGPGSHGDHAASVQAGMSPRVLLRVELRPLAIKTRARVRYVNPHAFQEIGVDTQASHAPTQYAPHLIVDSARATSVGISKWSILP